MQSLIKICLIALFTFFLVVSLVWAVPVQDMRKDEAPLTKDQLNAIASCLPSFSRGKKVAVYANTFDFISDAEVYSSYLVGINEPEWTEKYLLRPEPREIVEYDIWLKSLLPFADKINKLPTRRKEDRFTSIVVTIDNDGKCKSDFQPTQFRTYFGVVMANMDLDYMEREAKISRKERMAVAQRSLNELAKLNAQVSPVNKQYLQDNPSLVHQYFFDLGYLPKAEADFLEQLGLTVPKEIFRI